MKPNVCDVPPKIASTFGPNPVLDRTVNVNVVLRDNPPVPVTVIEYDPVEVEDVVLIVQVDV
jgi:hypothetical protein